MACFITFLKLTVHSEIPIAYLCSSGHGLPVLLKTIFHYKCFNKTYSRINYNYLHDTYQWRVNLVTRNEIFIIM